MTTSKIVKQRLAANDGDKKKKHKKKVLLLALLLPLGLLGVAGATVGGLYAGGVFADSLINLNTCFTFGSTFTFATGNMVNKSQQFDKNTIWNAIKDELVSGYDKTTFINWINIPDPPSSGWKFNDEGGTQYTEWTITPSGAGSKRFQGSITFRALISKNGGGNLDTEWINTGTNRNVDVTTLGTGLNTLKNFTDVQLFGPNGILNKWTSSSTLDLNRIILQYDKNHGSGTADWETWDWAAVGNFGISGSTTPTDKSISLWDTTNQRYANLRLAASDDYYYGTNATFTIKLDRELVSDKTNWKSFHLKRDTTAGVPGDGGFYKKPSNDQCAAAFELAYDGQQWWNNFVSAGATYSFGNTSDPNGTSGGAATGNTYLNYSGSPYYRGIDGKPADGLTGNGTFTYDMYTKSDLDDGVFVKGDGSEITNLGSFYQKPTEQDVIDTLIAINSSLRNTIVWSELNFIIKDPTAGFVTVEAIDDSIFYYNTHDMTYSIRS